MINALSYIGMDLQSEVCLWTLLGLLRTIFDATLFKVNANLKQVWQMKMPEELTRSVQRVLRTMISGVILVQCFTVYVYLASYIVLLYPVFLEERPALVLPWLLLAAIRKLLCELMSLALGLGTCVLLGPARPPCIKFLIVKLVSITPAFYTWLLVFSYYHTLKMSAAFKTFPAVLPPNDRDYGLELAVRRRRTKSLQGEDQLRRKLIDSLYGDRNPSVHMFNVISNQNIESIIQTPCDSIENVNVGFDVLRPLSITSNRTISDMGTYEDWSGNDVPLPRDTDRILEQFGVMLLRIAAYLQKEEVDSIKIFHTSIQTVINNPDILKCTAVANDDNSTPSHTDSSNCKAILGEKASVSYYVSTFENELIQVKNTSNEKESEKHEAFVNTTESKNFVSYEVIQRTKTIDISVRTNKFTEQDVLRETNDTTVQTVKEYTAKENIKSNNVECKAKNTVCRLNGHNKSFCTDKQLGTAESVTSIQDSMRSRDKSPILNIKNNKNAKY